MKKRNLVLLALISGLSFSCEKTYTCVCTTHRSETTAIDTVKTTRLGSKGYKKTCENFAVEDSLLRNCHLE